MKLLESMRHIYGYHRKIATRHPFLIYYRFIATGVEVVAVLDGRSLPSDLDALLRRRQGEHIDALSAVLKWAMLE